MKKILFAVCLIFISGITVAQWQQTGNVSPYETYESPTKLAKDMLSDNITLPEPHMNANLSQIKILGWNWDTLTCFNASNMLLERYTQTFDDNGNIQSRSVEHRLRIDWINFQKTTYTYSSDGQMQTELEQFWQNGAWENSKRYTYTYTNDGKLQTIMLENWQLDIWINNSKATYTYDINGRLAMVLNESWHFVNWENYRKTTYTYDPDGNMLLWISQLWRNRTWVNDWKYSYNYDVNGNNITILHQNGFENTWVNEWSDTRTYNNLGKVLNEVYETWQINEWVNKIRWTNTYDINGKLILCKSDLWQGDVWMNYDRHIYTYGLYLLSDLLQLYKDGVWVNDWKYIYDYDFRGNMITHSRQKWLTKLWKFEWRYSYLYDKFGNSLSGKYEKWDLNAGWLPGIPDNGLGVFSQKNQIFLLNDIYRYAANYQTFISDISDLTADNNSLLLYPNPSNDNITIELKLSDAAKNEVISVCDILGNLILQQSLQEVKTTLNISDLSSGIYFIKVETKNGVIIKKLVKE